MELKSKNKQQIIEVAYGVWLWQMPDGSFVADDEGHFFMIAGTQTDPVRPNTLRDAVRSEFGITEGRPHFMSGHRIISDEEYETQKQRMAWGLIPDPLDVPAIEEARRNGTIGRN